MGRMEPAPSVMMYYLCDLALDKLGNLSLEVRIERHSHFDVLTEVCHFGIWMISTLTEGSAHLDVLEEGTGYNSHPHRFET